MTDLLKQSTALKTQYLRQSSQAVTLVGQIQSDAGWAIESNPRISDFLQADGFLVTDANDIKKHVAPELLNLQLEIFVAKRPLVESLGSVMATLVNMKRASM